MGVVSAHDVAAYILGEFGRPMTTWKLQKLMYYSQAWSLVWDEAPLFRARIEAWANGPVVPQLYHIHKGQFCVREWPVGDPDNLNYDQMETLDAVLKYYGKKTGQQLSDLAHRERPWRNARKGLDPDERTCRVITHDSMSEYYSSLPDPG